MRLVLETAGVVGALVVGSCHSAPFPRPESSVPRAITLERTTCFGMCPAYQLTVNRTGDVSFLSRGPTDSARTATARVAPSVLDSLYARAVRIGFFALPDTLTGNHTFCARWATDLPGATVTINTNSGAKRVYDYHGCAADSPAAAAKLHELRAFEADIDSVTGSRRWTEPVPPIVSLFDSLRIALGIPGLAVIILRDTTIEVARGLGYADVEHQTPVTPETPFNIGSVSKPISAVVALKLVENGALDLDRPMRSFKGFAGFCDAVQAEKGIFFRDYHCETDRLTLRHVLSMTANGEPGTRFWYNPPSYSWASRPMAEVSGRAFSDLVDSLVFHPAGMTNSARIHRNLPLRPDLAVRLAIPYHTDSAGRLVRSGPPPPQGDGAAGGVIASAMDLARFDIALADGRLLSPASRAKLWTPTRTSAGVALPYGLGWFLGTSNGRQLVWHTGLWEGQYSALYLKVLDSAPNERLTLILLANSDGLGWQSRLDEAAIERSPFAMAFLSMFPREAPPQ